MLPDSLAHGRACGHGQSGLPCVTLGGMRHGPLPFVLAAALLSAAGAGCAATTGGAAEATGPRLVAAERVPRLADLVQERTVFFTRRLGDGGEVVAFSFTPDEVTSRGRLIGTLAYDGRRGSGVVAGVAGTLGFARTGEAGCGRLTLALDETTLDALRVRARFEPVAVDLERAGRTGQAAAALCEGARDLVARLRELGGALEDLMPRD